MIKYLIDLVNRYISNYSNINTPKNKDDIPDLESQLLDKGNEDKVYFLEGNPINHNDDDCSLFSSYFNSYKK